MSVVSFQLVLLVGCILIMHLDSSLTTYVIPVDRFLLEYQRICGMCILSCRPIVITRIVVLLQLRCWLLRELSWIIGVHAVSRQQVQPQLRRHVFVGVFVLSRLPDQSERLVSVLRYTADTSADVRHHGSSYGPCSDRCTSKHYHHVRGHRVMGK